MRLATVPTDTDTMSPAADIADADATVDIAERVRNVALADPQRVALIHAQRLPGGTLRYRRFTYRQLSDRAEALAVGLRRIGVVEGTRCSFMVPPGFDAMVLGLALWRVGAIVVGIEPHSHGLRSVARSLAKVEPEVFFGTPSAHVARLAFGWGRSTIRTNVVVGPLPLPGMVTLGSLASGPVPARPAPPAVRPTDPAVIAFTTGSTGAPKPTVLEQRNLAAMMATVLGHWRLDDHGGVVDMPTFPMFWIIGLASGGTVVVPPMDFTMQGPGAADPALLLRTIRDCGVTSMFGSPALLTNLAHHARHHGITDVGLRRIVAGGAEVPGPLFAEVRHMLAPGGEMYSDYGATEALPVTEISGATVLGETWARTEAGAGVCVGHPLPGVEVRIIAIDDGPIPDWNNATELPAGAIGEVVARSPHISPYYFRQPEATAENKIADHGGAWHRVGDTGYLDDDGRVWVCGRRSHRVVTARGVAYPLCCEPVANAHPAVARSALVGVNGRDGRRRALLCVQLTDEWTPSDDLTAELRSLLADHEATRLVDDVIFVARVPVDRRHNAKIDRPALARTLDAQSS